MKAENEKKGQLAQESGEMRRDMAELEEEALRRREDTYRSYFDHLSDVILSIGPDFILLNVSPSVERLLGYKPEALIGKPFHELGILTPEALERAHGDIKRVLSEEKILTAEYEFLTRDGEKRIAELNGAPLSREGKVAEVVCVARDITDRKLAEEALRESERRYRILADHVADVIFTMDIDLRFTYVSPSVIRLLGYTPEEMLGLRMEQVLASDSAKLAQRIYEEEMAIEASGAQDPERERALELELAGKEGSTVWAEVKMSFIRDADGSPLEILGVARDLSERRQAERALRQSGEDLRALFDHAAAGMALVDIQGYILAANQAICRFLGYSQEEIIGMSLSDLTHPHDLDRDLLAYESLVKGGRRGYIIDKRFVRKHGEIAWGRLTISLIRDQDGQPQYTIVVCEDITDRRRAEEKLRESETRYRAVIEQSPDGIYLVDVETRQILEANSAFQRMLGYSYPEILGLTFYDFVVADREDLDQRLAEVVKGTAPLAFERTYRRKDGSLLIAWISTRVISFGGRRAVLVLVRDLTERKRAEEELKDSHTRLLTILDGLEADIYVADLKTHDVLFVNRHMQASFGNNTVGKKCWKVFRKESGPCPFCTNDRLIDSGGNPTGLHIWEGENPITGKWYVNYDRAIRWIGDRLVRLQIAVDITERKQAEETLQESEARYRAIMEQATEGIYLVDRETRRITECNQAFAEMLGYSPSEVVGLAIYDLIAADREEIDQRLEGMVDHGGVISLERKLRKKDGSLLDVWIRAKIVTYRGMSVNLSIASDITEQKRMEQALRESEAGFRAIMERSPDGIYLGDTHSKRVLETNKAFQQLLGYSPEELVGIHLYDIVAADPKDIDDRFQKALSRGREVPFDHERRYRRKDGSLVEVWVRGTTLTYGGREVMCTIVRDITERKRTEEALRESEERYRAVVEQSPDGIVLDDVETRRILEVNAAFREMLGYTWEEVPGLTIYDIVAADREDVQKRFEKILNSEKPFAHERQYRRKDGSLIDVWLTSKVISYGGRKATCTLVRDLTEKKALEAQFLEAQRMECIGLLVGGVAHDLNNILSPILMNAELLQRVLPDPRSQSMLSSIASNAQRGGDIVRQILAFSRGLEGEYLLIPPKHLLREIKKFLQETFPRSIQLEVETPEDLWPISGDATQLRQVLMNLCLNARDAMEKGGSLVLSAANVTLDEAYSVMNPDGKPGPYLLFTVSDTGKGISSQHLPKIFNPFFTTKERGKGTGLGLATVQAIVKGHRGFVRVSSEVGKGSRFEVFLPASPGAATTGEIEEKAPVPAGNGELILLIEDESPVREITQATLESYGYRVLSASEGVEAVAMYVQHKGEVQAVLTDMIMPLMDGVSTIRALQKINPQIKIIAVSGGDWEERSLQAEGLSVQGFLQKPFTAERLLRTLAEVLKGGGQ